MYEFFIILKKAGLYYSVNRVMAENRKSLPGNSGVFYNPEKAIKAAKQLNSELFAKKEGDMLDFGTSLM